MGKVLDEDLVYEILSVVAEIPAGCVASYGQIARLIGREKNSRLVGAVLSEADRYGDYPCHRVVNHAGRLAPNFPDQRALLTEEGVAFRDNGCVDMKKHQWNEWPGSVASKGATPRGTTCAPPPDNLWHSDTSHKERRTSTRHDRDVKRPYDTRKHLSDCPPRGTQRTRDAETPRQRKGRELLCFRPEVSWSRGADLNHRPSGYEVATTLFHSDISTQIEVNITPGHLMFS